LAVKSLGNMRLPLAAVLVFALPVLAGSCRRIAIADDFRSPYERESILMPQATRSYLLDGPPGVRVDIGLDFEEGAQRADRLKLAVGKEGRQRMGARVPGSQLSRAVCGVVLTHGGVPVQVENLNALRSAPFAIRIERSPSLMCQPHRVMPSSALARR
jgi:hypothetical protein